MFYIIIKKLMCWLDAKIVEKEQQYGCRQGWEDANISSTSSGKTMWQNLTQMFNVMAVTIYLHYSYPAGHFYAFVSQQSCIFKTSEVRKQTDMFMQLAEAYKQIRNGSQFSSFLSSI